MSLAIFPSLRCWSHVWGTGRDFLKFREISEAALMVMSAGFEAAWVGFTLAAGDSVSEQASCWGGSGWYSL